MVSQVFYLKIIPNNVSDEIKMKTQNSFLTPALLPLTLSINPIYLIKYHQFHFPILK